jgi:hypothetical protein
MNLPTSESDSLDRVSRRRIQSHASAVGSLEQVREGLASFRSRGRTGGVTNVCGMIRDPASRTNDYQRNHRVVLHTENWAARIIGQ